MKYIYQFIYIAFYGFLNTNADKTIHSTIGYNTTQAHGMTIQYSTTHYNVTRHNTIRYSDNCYTLLLDIDD